MSAIMPELVHPGRGVRHTIDSAIPALRQLGVELDRMTLTSAGPGWTPGTVVAQQPAAGTPLSSEARVHLSIAGSGMMERLPFPLRGTSDTEFRVDRLVGLFDDAFLKLVHYIRSAGGVLDLHPDDPASAARWIHDLFGVDHRQWAQERWYDIARLLPSLPRIAGRPDGPALALRAVFRLPASATRLVTGLAPVPEGQTTRLGTRNGRLGIDALIGEGIVAHTSVAITIGPVDVATWQLHTRPAIARERQALYRLLLPAHLRHTMREHWLVGDRNDGIRIGVAAPQVLLGVNSYLGKAERGTTH